MTFLDRILPWRRRRHAALLARLRYITKGRDQGGDRGTLPR